ncbi:MAG: hypothetical protein ABL967_01285 [Bryobacteraceae bacterium]
MADFRKLVYAVASVGLFAGLSVSANAQGLFCDSLTAAPQIVRAEGYTELVGDITLRCRATVEGVTTPAGVAVKQANVHVAILGTTVTGRTVASGFNEALLMIDEPGTITNQVQLLCGSSTTDAPDNGPSGAGVCAITSTGIPSQTYDGTVGSSSYGTGRPNIYQGRPDGPNGVVFPFVPFDPPGSNTVRTIRITNIRIDATRFDPASFPQITAVVTVEGPASVTLQFNNTVVATVLKGMGATSVTADKGFLQCISEPGGHEQVESISIVEGFRSAWKAKNVVQYVENYNGFNDLSSWLASTEQYRWDGGTYYGAGDLNQNIPDYRYFSESGFMNPGYSTRHGQNKAGVADYGTRISFAISAPPSGTSLSIPTTAYLSNGAGNTGVAKLTNYTSGTTGLGAYSPVSGSRFTIPAGGATVVYEVLFSDPGSIETLFIDGLLSYSAPTTDAAVGVTTTVGTATFAPYYTSVGSDSNGIPRFKQTTGPAQDFVAIGKCSCSLLFPWVVSDSNYVTGFAVSNTSMDPTNASSLNVPGYSANQQSGTVTVYYFGRTGSNPVSSGTAAQSASSPSANVAAGSFATFLAPSGFAGYAIANSQFQYCHGVAFLFSTNGSVPPMSYLGLVMDGVVGSKSYRGYDAQSANVGWWGSGDAQQLQRTIQVFKDSLGQ